MSVARQLADAIKGDWGPPVGNPSKPGIIYRGKFGGHSAVLEKRKKNFFLIWRGRRYDLGKRATFDHAERIIFREEREMTEAKRKGSYFDQGRIPKDGEKIWALVGQVDQKPVQGTVLRVDRTYHGGHYHCDVQTAKGVKRVSSDVLFDHRPKRVKRQDQFGEVTVWENLEEAKSAAFYDSLYRRNKGIFWRGEGKGGKTTGLGAIGAGVYVTWHQGMAQAFANMHGGGEVIACKLKKGLKMMDAKGKEMAKIKRGMGFEPWEYSGDKLFANEITRAAKKLGFDGVASDNIAEGIVVFDPKHVTRVKG